MGMINNKLIIRPGFLIMIAAVVFFEGFGAAVTTIMAAGVHELGHIAALYCFGKSIYRIRLNAAGAVIESTGTTSHIQDCFIALAGPAASFLAAFSFASIYGEKALVFMGVNMLYGFLNLLPVSTADGGSALSSILSCFLEHDTVFNITSLLDILICILVSAAGIYVFFYSKGNVSLLLCAILLSEACCKRRKISVKFYS